MRPQTLSLILTLLSLAPATQAATIINGDFETGNFTGWTTGNSNAAITTPGLVGTFSALLPGQSGGGNLAQILSGNANILRLDFAMPDPGGAGDRGFNVFVRQSTVSGAQLNIRVVDISNDGQGDVQIFHSAASAWQTITPLLGSVSFSDTNSFALKFNSFGASLNYDLSINGNTAAGLNFTQNGAPSQFGYLIFSNEFGQSQFTVDNIIVPEPSRALLLLLSLTALLSLHRKKKPTT